MRLHRSIDKTKSGAAQSIGTPFETMPVKVKGQETLILNTEHLRLFITHTTYLLFYFICFFIFMSFVVYFLPLFILFNYLLSFPALTYVRLLPALLLKFHWTLTVM